MIPVLSARPARSPASDAFLADLVRSGFGGDIDTRYATRLSVATDNSVYQLLPDAVVFPKSLEDVCACARLLGEPRHTAVTAVPRGGGTGTNGQALSPGIVIDLSRHLNRILETSNEGRTVRLEPGVVLDDLNRSLKSGDLFFAPTLSPSSRATLGGMISTNASGKGSRIYGRTADHVLELKLVVVGGQVLRVREVTLAEATQLSKMDSVEGRLYGTVLRVLSEHAAEIESVWPNMPRTLTGYDLRRARRVDAQGREFINLIPLIAGAEGTLGFIVEATLRTTKIPKYKRTVALKYAEFEDALAAAEVLVATDPAAIETVDSRILTLARKDAIWHKVAHLLDGTDEPKAVNLVEFVGEDEQAVATKVSDLVATVEQSKGQPRAATALVVAETQQDAASLWELRKKGVGLLGALQGDRRPIAFVEDTAVPPARLSAYVRDFRKLLDDEGLIYGMFGHVDVGCLHVRPALNLRDPADELRLRKLSDQVVALVKRHGGVFWGEHGKGFRSEYVPEFFGEALFSALCDIKEAFDPKCQLNPGKLAIVKHGSVSLVSVDATKKGAYDRQITPESQKHFDVAIHCNGNGQCFNTDPNSVMCPSSKFRRDRVHSPKGRATVLREWLRQLSREGTCASTELTAQAGRNTTLAGSLALQIEGKRGSQYDFSHEVYEALDGCLSCKACATQCPIKVDVPRMKSEFLSLYHERYARPLRDYFVAALEHLMMFLSFVPRLFNFLVSLSVSQFVMTRVVGIVDTPLLPTRSLRQGLRARGVTYLTEAERARLASLPREELSRHVVIVQDAFTTFYEPEVVLAAVDLLRKLGNSPLVLPFFPNGKALIVKGFLGAFRAVAARNATHLSSIATLGIPLIGLEPAVTLTYRDEYPAVLGTKAIAFKVELVQEWLLTQSEGIRTLAKNKATRSAEPLTLLGHCTERTMVPAAEKAWQAVFSAASIALSVPSVGCCGMCGVFGHEAAHLEESRGIYKMSWQQMVQTETASGHRVTVSGHSCRSQVHRVDGTKLPHPIQVLLEQVS